VNATPVKRKLAAILATDAVGYSRMMAADEEGTMKVLSAHRSVIDGIIEFHEGRIINTAGDSVLAEFVSPTQAVRCAVEIQDALKTRNDSLPEAKRMLFRIGVNLGDVMVKGDDLLGDGVNVAARLEGIADPGGICVSSSVYDQIAGKLDLGFVNIGAQNLKNIQRPIQVYRVERGGAQVVPAAPRRRTGAWIAGLTASFLVVTALAWVFVLQPLLRSAELRSAEQAKIEGENARLRLEAADAKQRAAAEAKTAAEAKRSIEERRAAESRARQDADIARAEANTARRKAAADEAARRSAERAARAAVAPAPQPPVEARLAAPPPAAAPRAPRAAEPAPATATPLSYQGLWQAALSCRAFAQRQAFSITIPVSVTDRTFTLQRGQAGAPESFQLSGRPEANGRLLLAGDGVAGSTSRRQMSGQPYKATFDGRFEGPQYKGTGQLGAQECALAITRAP